MQYFQWLISKYTLQKTDEIKKKEDFNTQKYEKTYFLN